MHSALKTAAVGLAGMLLAIPPALAQQKAAPQKAPRHAVVASWPQPLPDNMILGQVAGIAVGKNDTVWIIHRPASLDDDEKGLQKSPPATRCCTAAPPVLQATSRCSVCCSPRKARRCRPR